MSATVGAASDSPALDAGAFALRLLGAPLWDHQLELVRSPARYRVVCAGRQVGKSRSLAVLALFEAATRRGITVLLVSAGEVASLRLLEECAGLASASPLLAGSVVNELRTSLTLSNGSRILSVPASQRQVRGWAVDLLIVDEAAFIDPELWRAAEPSIIARPGSRVVLCSTPWGGSDHFFKLLWQRGMDAPDEQVQAWHWPSSVSPLVDDVLLEEIRLREAPDYFEREFLAVWTSESGAYFTTAELDSAVADVALVSPEQAAHAEGGPRSLPVVGGVDWGVRRDANAVALVGLLEDFEVNAERLQGGWALWVPYVQARLRWGWDDFIERLLVLSRSFGVQVLASEINGPGDYPTQRLREELRRAGLMPPWVCEVWTDTRRKQAGFGQIKGLLQAGRLVLPREPELLKQLRGLEFEQLSGGGFRLAVPERVGHDDLAMALMQAVSCVAPQALSGPGVRWPGRARPAGEAGSLTGGGLWVPSAALPATGGPTWWRAPRGGARSEQAWK
ncbi:MAG: terminase family protein [Quadrisphaera sp.]